MTRDEPTPPQIPNHQFERYVASGGFGDVFAYRDNLGRRVAVKVLKLAALTPEKLEEFRTEASLMASLEHDNVVRVNTFATAPDGRPYISMEYCPDHLGNVARSRQLPVHEVLKHGIKVASAVDAAHGRGLYHRDIKPANVLLKANGQPALTDFGIAGGRDVAVGQRGVSLQFGAPEVIDESTDGEVLADVYSLGATVHALLTGHSPMYDPTGANDDATLIDRALHGARPSTGRSDVPASLERELIRAMSIEPRGRHHSAMVFARALQRVEAELGFAPTNVPFVADDQIAAAPRDRAAGGEEGTRLAPQRVDPTGRGPDDTSPPPARVSPATPSGPNQDLPTRGRAGDDRTATPPDRIAPTPRAAEQEEAPADEDGTSTRGRTVLVASAIVVVLAGVVAALMTGGGGGTEPTAAESPAVTVPDDGSLFSTPVAPTDVRVTQAGDEVEIRWSDAGSEEASYVVSFTAGALEGESRTVEEAPLVLPAQEVGAVCVRVLEVIGSASSEPSREECL